MRPNNLDDFVGQDHLVGKGSVLRNMIDSGNISSFILWGPPGVGKTTLAKIIAKQLNRPFYILSAVSSGVKDVRDIIDKSRKNSLFNNSRPILFIDEIHRFSKSQQDALLGAVEDGTIVLIGATTENPSFEVITPLLSRCQVYVLKPLDTKSLDVILERALKEDQILKNIDISVDEKEALYRYSGGDARKLLNILDIIVQTHQGNKKVTINNKVVIDKLQENIALYDKNGEQHYDIISAFIKSIRGSDPNGAVYWLARMLAGGEDILFIARRMVILASEDIGLANPNALLLANACFDSVNKIGMPESRIILSETAIYLATSPKSNSAYLAIDAAMEEVQKNGGRSVPLHLRNAPTSLMKELGYSDNYKYAHDFPDNFVEQEFLPENIESIKFYEPGNNKHEIEIRKRLSVQWKKYNY
ncbi:MAG TPA: replication-associated recombination protein A [Bacteroidales bacterium]|nr:replication-associated recombination protein A [Bacteroidales bacterium]HRR49552.1 replication-associated recombination protein A [Bacteroidales bacterium]